MKRGFTLIELLAVIVILAVIALISTPLITNTIENSRKNAAIQSAINYMDAVELSISEQLLNDTNMPEKNGIYEVTETSMKKGSEQLEIRYKGTNVAGLVEMKNNHVALGEFIIGNYQINCKEKNCSDKPLSDYIKTGVNELIHRKLSTELTGTESGLYGIDKSGSVINTTSNSDVREYRYIGNNPNNYVKFNNELWQIIGIFDKKLKIIRSQSIGTKKWDDKNKNNWETSYLKEYLNNTYYKSINSVAQTYISDNIWMLGGFDSPSTEKNQVYKDEQSNKVYGSNASTWTGKIGLMSPSDYGYAASTGCTKNLFNYNHSSCSSNNWLYHKVGEWTLTSTTSSENYVFYISNSGQMSSGGVTYNYAVYPTLYLNMSTGFASGEGTKANPYILK